MLKHNSYFYKSKVDSKSQRDYCHMHSFFNTICHIITIKLKLIMIINYKLQVNSGNINITTEWK